MRSPDGIAVPDLAGKLPGRGVWLTADRELAATAEKKKLFSRGFKAQTAVPEGLADLLEKLIADRLVQQIALARKAGQAVTGFEKVKSALQNGAVRALIEASDGSADGRDRLLRLANGVSQPVPVIGALTGHELGLAFGRDFAIHAALEGRGVADRALFEARRLSGFRPTPEWVGESGMTDEAGQGRLTDRNEGSEAHDAPLGMEDMGQV